MNVEITNMTITALAEVGFTTIGRVDVMSSTSQNIPLTMDTSAREAMKDAAKCDKHCELQISANQ